MLKLALNGFPADLGPMINDSGVGIAIFHGDAPDDLVLTYYNEVRLENCGLTAAELGAMFAKGSLYGVCLEETADTRAKLAQAFQDGKPVCCHIRVKGRDDACKWISLRFNVRRLESGIEACVMFSDTAEEITQFYADAEKYRDLLRTHDRSEKNSEFLIDVLTAVAEFKNYSSGPHVGRVRAMTEIMLCTWSALYPKEGFDDVTIREIAMASTVYDIGKTAIPDSILLKPGKLTREEFEIVKMHTLRGCEMLERIKREDSEFYRYCYDICRYHHERSDGNGYPEGLKESEIPVWAQIVSIIDVFVALISPKVYKAPCSTGMALEMIQNGECGVFSDKLLRCFEMAKSSILEIARR